MGIVLVNDDAVQESRCVAGRHSLGELRGGGEAVGMHGR